jgi:hypothetical protein
MTWLVSWPVQDSCRPPLQEVVAIAKLGGFVYTVMRRHRMLVFQLWRVGLLARYQDSTCLGVFTIVWAALELQRLVAVLFQHLGTCVSQ